MALARERHQRRTPNEWGLDQVAMRATLLQRSADCIAVPSSTGAYAVRKEATKLTPRTMQLLDSMCSQGGLGTCYTVCTMVRRVFAVVSLVVAGIACASPTLPLPPPEVPTIGPGAMAGQVHLSSTRGAEPNAYILVTNQAANLPVNERAQATEADGQGSWQLDVWAKTGDVLQVQQISGEETSPSASVQVP